MRKDMDGIARAVEQLVPPDKLCHVDLEACPKFCTLLSRLSSHYLSRDGTDLKSVAKLEKRQQQLQQSRLEWLKCKVLYTEVEELLEQSQIEAIASSATSTDIKALDAIQRGLSHAEATQYMHMPPVEHAQPRAEPASILGVPMSEVVKNSSTATKAASKLVRKHALPKLQANLQRKASDLRAFYLPQGSSQGTSLATVVRSDAEKLRASKRQFVDNQMQLDRLRSQCYDVLWRGLELLDSILVEHKLNNSALEERYKSLIVRCQTVALKLQVLELQVLCETYTAPNTAALTVVKHQLDSARQEADAEQVDISAALSAYSSLGMGFDSIVDEFTRLQGELENKRWALSELQQS